MKRYLLFLLLIAGILCLTVLSCTPPPPEDTSGGDETPVVETENGGRMGTEIDSDAATMAEDGLVSPVEIEIEEPADETEGDTEAEEVIEESAEEGEIEAEEGEVDEGDTMTETSEVPENIFGGYEEWPTDAITDEEVELLSRIVVVFETTKGIIKVRLFPEAAPLHAANCVKLVQEGFYDGLTFHRVIADFMTQGGDPEGTGAGDVGYTLPAEISLPHVAGSMSAARLPEYDPYGNPLNLEKRSSGCQFYWCHTDQSCSRLNGAYTVYGQIVEGLDVNLSLSVNYTGEGPIPGAETDSIIKAWIEMG